MKESGGWTERSGRPPVSMRRIARAAGEHEAKQTRRRPRRATDIIAGSMLHRHRQHLLSERNNT